MITRYLPVFLLLLIAYKGNTQCFMSPSQVCAGACGPVFYLQSDPPGTTYEWSISCGTITNPSKANPHIACFNTPGLCTLQVIILSPGEAPDTCTALIEVIAHTESFISENICSGDSIEINGTYYTEGNYHDTIFGGSSLGCDSILNIEVTAPIPDSAFIDYLGCSGDGYSIAINNIFYDESNPTGTVYLNGTDGCDSTIIVNLVFQPLSSDTIQYLGCSGDGYAVIVNDILYDEINPTGIEILTGANGCDSIVYIALVFLPPTIDTITYHGCTGDGYSIIVGDSLFNENNPSGTIVFDSTFCDSSIIVDLTFDTLVPSIVLTGNQVCAFPLGMQYSWYNCSGSFLPDTTNCITVNGVGCVCVIINTGGCIDTLCQEYTFCELSCDIISPLGVCTGDSLLLTATGNFTGSANLDWTIMTDSSTTVVLLSTDSVWVNYYSTGCYSIDLNVQDLGCVTSCTDTICVIEKPLADLCCDQILCDTCATISVWLAGNPPWNIAISDGTTIDTINGITTTSFDYLACPPYDSLVYYSLLWVQDSTGMCTGGIINDSVSIYLEERPVASITVQGDSLCAQPSGFAYGWIDCQNSSNLSFDQCFVPNTSGCYCVTVSTLVTDCIDTACIEFILSGTSSPGELNNINVWYDREQHSVLIDHHQKSLDVTGIQLADVLGRKIMPESVERISDEMIRIRIGDLTVSILYLSLYSDDNRTGKVLYIPD